MESFMEKLHGNKFWLSTLKLMVLDNHVAGSQAPDHAMKEEEFPQAQWCGKFYHISCYFT